MQQLQHFSFSKLLRPDGSSNDYVIAAVFAVGYFVVRFLLDRCVYEPIGRFAIFPKKKKSDDSPNHAQRKKLVKFKGDTESFWKSNIYGCFAVTAALCSYHERFFTDTKYFWLGCTQLPCDFEVSRGIRLLYCLEMGFYTAALPMLIFWEHRRKDFYETFAHHVATLALIVYSHWVNFAKVGTMVFLLHDVNDGFMEAAKMANYTGRDSLSTALFICFVLSWIATRLTYFPLWVIRSCLHEPIELIGKVYNISPHPHYEIFNGLLIFLFSLHLYWTWLIMRVGWKMRQGKVTDVRETEDGS